MREGTEIVRVLGEGTEDRRYAIENYLLDPLLVARAIIREDRASACKVGFGARETIYDVDVMGVSRLQQIVSAVQSEILQGITYDSSALTEVEYVGGMRLKVVNAFMTMSGHDLEDRVKNAFPMLKRFHQAGALLRWMVDPVISEAPQFVPSAIRLCFEQVLESELVRE